MKNENIKVENKPVKPRKLTLKQRLFVKEYIKNKGNATESAMSVYDVKTRAVAGAIGNENLQKPYLKEYINQQLDSAGLTDYKIFDGINRTINAGIGEKPTNADAQRGLFELLKLKGYYPDRKTEVNKKSLTLNLQAKDNTDVMEELKQLLINIKNN